MSANDRQVGGDHYKLRRIQHWDVTAPYGLFCLLYAASKYCDRFQEKGGKESLEKALHYLDKTIELYEADTPSIVFRGGQVPLSVAMEYIDSLDYHKTLSSAIQFILCGDSLADLRAARQWLRLAIEHYYPNV